MFKRKLSAVAIGLAGAVGSAGAADPAAMPIIRVESEAPADAAATTVEAEDPRAGMPADGGDWLLSVPGVSGVRMGSHGIDPVIRGQSQTQLNILLDGAYVHGGCPNRMDPPSSYATAETYDKVTVLKGVQTLLYGAGGPGGTVLFERVAPSFEPGDRFKGRIGGGYNSSGDASDVFADVAGGGESAWIRAIATAKKADSYEDGDGNDVRSGYKERSGVLGFGYAIDTDTQLKVDLESVRGEDILFAGAGMDSPQSDSDTVKLSFERNAPVGPLDSLKLELYRADVFHVMDNYSLRTPSTMYARVPSDSVTEGGRLIGDLALGEGVLSLGIDYQSNDRDATRYAGMMADPTMVNSYLWPGVEISQLGLIAEYARSLGEHDRYVAGLRVDRASASASDAALDPAGMPMGPNQLYQLYYGRSADDHDETNVGALLRLEHDLAGSGTTLFAALSRTPRTADATERYMAANGMTPSARWVGNPGLDPEIHNQLELGASWARERWSASGALFYDDVQDYILRDRAHGQDGVLRTDGATIYRNVEARLYGADVELNYQWSETWSSRATLAYVHATNTSDDRPIAQTPPLEGTVSLDYTRPRWSMGGALRMVATQTRVDDDPATGSGLDVGETPGFAVLDLYGSARLGRSATLRFGMDNVFDRTYAEHLNKSNAFDPVQVQVNEPGRAVWMRARVDF